MTPDQLAQLAASLKDNEAFQAALDKTRQTAMEALATVKRDDEAAFYTAQAMIAVVDDIRANLTQFIRSGQAVKKAPIA